jgi:dihydrolipoamide dehydrogenase
MLNVGLVQMAMSGRRDDDIAHTMALVRQAAAKGAKVTIEDQATKKTETIDAEKVLVAIGVAGRFDGLFDASLGLKTDKGHISTDYMEKKDKATYVTSVPGIYAVGDVIGPPWLAHVSSEEAVVAVATKT